MEIRLLKKGYKNSEQFYKDFLEDRIRGNDEYFTEEVAELSEAPDFPIYINTKNESERKKIFLKAFDILSESYLNTSRDYHLEEVFWHSLLVVEKREYLLREYPQIRNGIGSFRNVVVKNFDWENYIYKCVLGAEYISDAISGKESQKRYYELIVDNLDIYNYIIKYEIFRNGKFLVNILDIIDELNLSQVMKKKLKGRDDLGADERVGRRVIYEFNKSYPVIMSPMLEKEDLQKLFLEYLSYYHDITQETPIEEEVKESKRGLLSLFTKRI